jgi:hypothetical protein
MAGQNIFKTTFTVAGRTILLLQPTAPTLVSVVKHTSGIVVFGKDPELGPIASGKGVQATSEPRYFILNANIDALYVFAESEESISFIASPLDALFMLARPEPVVAGVAPAPSTQPVALPNPYDHVRRRR